jgi:hypothetical protein
MTVMMDVVLPLEAGPVPEQLVGGAAVTCTVGARAGRPGGRRPATVTRPDAYDRDE